MSARVKLLTMLMIGVLAITVVFWVLAVPEVSLVGNSASAEVDVSVVKTDGAITKFDGRVFNICLGGYEYYWIQRWHAYSALSGLSSRLDKDGKPVPCQNVQ